jgi:hypothetical protein
VTVAINFPDEEAGVRKHLERSTPPRATSSSADDQYALMKAVDPEWNGAVPYSMIIAPAARCCTRRRSARHPEGAPGHPRELPRRRLRRQNAYWNGE